MDKEGNRKRRMEAAMEAVPWKLIRIDYGTNQTNGERQENWPDVGAPHAVHSPLIITDVESTLLGPLKIQIHSVRVDPANGTVIIIFSTFLLGNNTNTVRCVLFQRKTFYSIWRL